MNAFRRQWGLWLSLAAVIGFFIAASYFARTYEEQIIAFVREGPPGLAIVAYAAFTVFATVAAPVASLPLLPAAAAAWGSFWAGIITAAGWTTGSIIAFLIARRYGQAVVRRFASERMLEKIHEYIPSQDGKIFWFLVVLRMLFPVDALSYAVGLFTRVRLGTYAGATAVGILPGAMAFAYIGALSLGWQLAGLAAGGTAVALGIWLLRRRIRSAPAASGTMW